MSDVIPEVRVVRREAASHDTDGVKTVAEQGRLGRWVGTAYRSATFALNARLLNDPYSDLFEGVPLEDGPDTEVEVDGTIEVRVAVYAPGKRTAVEAAEDHFDGSPWAVLATSFLYDGEVHPEYLIRLENL